MSRRAFTLVELLIVIAIIGILFAMLVQTMAGIDFLKKNLGCQKNLKDIFISLNAYQGISGGRYPYPIDTYYGSKFSGNWVDRDPWAGMTQVRLMKQYGAEAASFFCPFDPQYGQWDSWPSSTWKTPYRGTGTSLGSAYVYVGYAFFLYRAYPYNTAKFSNMANPVCTYTSEDDTPMVADNLFTRASGQIKGGWYHGGGLPDGLYNADCNTLFKGGAVVHTDKEEFDWNNPSFVIGSSVDYWWCALNPK